MPHIVGVSYERDTMSDQSHLHAIEDRLIRERARLAAAKGERARALRAVWVAQAERELAAEQWFLGLTAAPAGPLSDDELLAALAA